MRINLTLSADEADAVKLAVQVSESLGFPVTEAQAVRTFMREGIKQYKADGKLGTKATEAGK